jgi:hypothetical protein
MRVNNKTIVFLISVSFWTAAVCNAQQKLKQKDIFAKQSNNRGSKVVSFPLYPNQILAITNPLPVIRYCMPKGGIFCQMESAIHQRLNFWIKFRMGTDDKYSD